MDNEWLSSNREGSLHMEILKISQQIIDECITSLIEKEKSKATIEKY